MPTLETRREVQRINALAARLLDQWHKTQPDRQPSMLENGAFMAGVVAAEIEAQRTDTALAWDAPSNRNFEPVEQRAKDIYGSFPGTDDHPWVMHGNSTKQDEARQMARDELREAGHADLLIAALYGPEDGEVFKRTQANFRERVRVFGPPPEAK